MRFLAHVVARLRPRHLVTLISMMAAVTMSLAMSVRAFAAASPVIPRAGCWSISTAPKSECSKSWPLEATPDIDIEYTGPADSPEITIFQDFFYCIGTDNGVTPSQPRGADNVPDIFEIRKHIPMHKGSFAFAGKVPEVNSQTATSHPTIGVKLSGRFLTPTTATMTLALQWGSCDTYHDSLRLRQPSRSLLAPPHGASGLRANPQRRPLF
jgi:hypothetical protein